MKDYEILQDTTVGWFNGYIYTTLIQDGGKIFIEFSNTKKRLVYFQVKNADQGKIIIRQIIPSLRKCDNYWEAHILLQTFHETNSLKEAVFLIRTNNTEFSLKEIEFLKKIYYFETKIHVGELTVDSIEYDMAYYVFLPGCSKPVGNFVGMFNKEKFTFIRR